MEEIAAAVRERVGSSDEVCRAALDVLEARVCERFGFEPAAPSASEGRRREVREAVETFSEETGVELGAALQEPHALGWFHQYFGEQDREESYRAHHEDGAKHETAGVTTQLYTPRWIADLLAREALDREPPAAPSVLDPAVGGGQMLLAAYETIREAVPDAPPAAIAGKLRGRDIDPRAVEVARRTLKLRAARDAGERVPEAEDVVDERVRTGDGLFELERGAEVVLTNPPYMGLRSMPEELKERVRNDFEPFHRDLYAAFIARCHELAESRVGILAQQTIWFLKSFRSAREELLERGELETFVHLGPHAFASLGGEKANVAAFVQRAFGTDPAGGSQPATFIDLRDLDTQRAMREAVGPGLEGSAESDRCIEAVPEEFAVIPGRPLAYWLPDALRACFEGERRLGDVAEVPGCQNKTGANREYVREWTEVSGTELWRRPLELDVGDTPERLAAPEDVRWVFYSKGGGYAPWWGNWQSVVDWSVEARSYYRENSTSNLLPERYRFRQGICYTDFGGQTFNARWMPPGCLFDMAGPAIVPEERAGGGEGNGLFALLGVLNTTPVRVLLNAMNPSIHYQVTDLRRLPLPEWSADRGARLASLAAANVRDARWLAAGTDESPVRRDDLRERSSGEFGYAEIAGRLRRRERELDRIALELYDLDPDAVDRVGGMHRYAPE